MRVWETKGAFLSGRYPPGVGTAVVKERKIPTMLCFPGITRTGLPGAKMTSVGYADLELNPPICPTLTVVTQHLPTSVLVQDKV